MPKLPIIREAWFRQLATDVAWTCAQQKTTVDTTQKDHVASFLKDFHTSLEQQVRVHITEEQAQKRHQTTSCPTLDDDTPWHKKRRLGTDLKMMMTPSKHTTSYPVKLSVSGEEDNNNHMPSSRGIQTPNSGMRFAENPCTADWKYVDQIYVPTLQYEYESSKSESTSASCQHDLFHPSTMVEMENGNVHVHPHPKQGSTLRNHLCRHMGVVVHLQTAVIALLNTMDPRCVRTTLPSERDRLEYQKATHPHLHWGLDWGDVTFCDTLVAGAGKVAFPKEMDAYHQPCPIRILWLMRATLVVLNCVFQCLLQRYQNSPNHPVQSTKSKTRVGTHDNLVHGSLSTWEPHEQVSENADQRHSSPESTETCYSTLSLESHDWAAKAYHACVWLIVHCETVGVTSCERLPPAPQGGGIQTWQFNSPWLLASLQKSQSPFLLCLVRNYTSLFYSRIHLPGSLVMRALTPPLRELVAVDVHSSDTSALPSHISLKGLCLLFYLNPQAMQPKTACNYLIRLTRRLVVRPSEWESAHALFCIKTVLSMIYALLLHDSQYDPVTVPISSLDGGAQGVCQTLKNGTHGNGNMTRPVSMTQVGINPIAHTIHIRQHAKLSDSDKTDILMQLWPLVVAAETLLRLCAVDKQFSSDHTLIPSFLQILCVHPESCLQLSGAYAVLSHNHFDRPQIAESHSDIQSLLQTITVRDEKSHKFFEQYPLFCPSNQATDYRLVAMQRAIAEQIVRESWPHASFAWTRVCNDIRCTKGDQEGSGMTRLFDPSWTTTAEDASLYRNLCDMEIVIPSGGGTVFQCHKMILAPKSAVCRKWLSFDTPTSSSPSQPVFRLTLHPNMNQSALHLVLQWVYSNGTAMYVVQHESTNTTHKNSTTVQSCVTPDKTLLDDCSQEGGMQTVPSLCETGTDFVVTMAPQILPSRRITPECAVEMIFIADYLGMDELISTLTSRLCRSYLFGTRFVSKMTRLAVSLCDKLPHHMCGPHLLQIAHMHTLYAMPKVISHLFHSPCSAWPHTFLTSALLSLEAMTTGSTLCWAEGSWLDFAHVTQMQHALFDSHQPPDS